jgi:hypothetical protein
MFRLNFIKAIQLPAVLFITLSFASCGKDDDQKTQVPIISYGNFVAVGNGKARTFISKNADGTVKQVGFTFSEDALSGLPAQNAAFALPMPSDNQTLIKHISFDYAVHGHGPEHIYDVPHFDVHYYMISEREKNEITLEDPKIDVLPPAASIPKNYVPGPNEAKMGKHWFDTTSHEYHGKDFTSTFIYGSYNGRFIFMEPMIAVSYLKEKPNVNIPVNKFGAVSQAGLYPQAYSILWEKERRDYTVALSDLVMRQK